MNLRRDVEVFADKDLTKFVDAINGAVVETAEPGIDGTPQALLVNMVRYSMPKLVSIGDSGFVIRAFEARQSGTLGGVVERFFLIY